MVAKLAAEVKKIASVIKEEFSLLFANLQFHFLSGDHSGLFTRTISSTSSFGAETAV